MTSEQLPERRPQKIDLNILPPEFLPKKASRLSILMVMVAIILACLAVPSIALKMDVNSKTTPLEDELAELTAQYNELKQEEQQANNLQNQIDDLKKSWDNMQEDYQIYVDGILLWSDIIAEVDDLIIGDRITLDNIDQKGSELELKLSGSGKQGIYIYDYAIALEESPYFMDVIIENTNCPSDGDCTFSFAVPLEVEEEAE